MYIHIYIYFHVGKEKTNKISAVIGVFSFFSLHAIITFAELNRPSSRTVVHTTVHKPQDQQTLNRIAVHYRNHPGELQSIPSAEVTQTTEAAVSKRVDLMAISSATWCTYEKTKLDVTE